MNRLKAIRICQSELPDSHSNPNLALDSNLHRPSRAVEPPSRPVETETERSRREGTQVLGLTLAASTDFCAASPSQPGKGQLMIINRLLAA